MECPGDVVLGEVVGAVASVPGVLAAGPGQLVREGGDEVVECPGDDGVVVGGDIEGYDADGIANPWTAGKKGPGSRGSSDPSPRPQPFRCLLQHLPHPRPSVTFENRADFPPYGNAPVSVVLAQRKLHVKEWDPPKDGHDGVRKEEGPCGRRETVLLPAHSCPQISPLMWRCAQSRLPGLSALREETADKVAGTIQCEPVWVGEPDCWHCRVTWAGSLSIALFVLSFF